MRTIKFRGHRLDNKEWVFGNLAQCDNGRAYIHQLVDADEDSWLYWEVDPNTVGQFMGLYDCEGREIYEGDIIRRKARISFLGNIKSSNHEVKFGEDGIYTGFYLDPPCDVFFNSHNGFLFKIIGNIYDMPEVVEGGAQ